uniref:Uncharacterized protein n=1 Tax=Timema genevievae TaxID=629358 RepID=A0A7R9PNA2_TIMGE|nr:unnamed protein product [Timema genevievae]
MTPGKEIEPGNFGIHGKVLTEPGLAGAVESVSLWFRRVKSVCSANVLDVSHGSEKAHDTILQSTVSLALWSKYSKLVKLRGVQNMNNMKEEETWPLPPEPPQDSDCCGNGCSVLQDRLLVDELQELMCYWNFSLQVFVSHEEIQADMFEQNIVFGRIKRELEAVVEL